MNKRRVNKQQIIRINKRQESYHQSLEDNELTEPGLVISRYGAHVLIEGESGQTHHCSMRTAIDSLVAGDQVVFYQGSAEKRGVVLSRLPRKSVLGRPDKRGILKPIAANISQIMIVIAPKPELYWPLLDSYLVMANYLNILPCIVLNKTDIPCDSMKMRLQQQYEPLGYRILFINHGNKTAIHKLQEILLHHTSVFVGQSGTGKSSLISTILPLELNIQSGAISQSTNLGKHTTSKSCFYHLPEGGALIDSPGVREFGLWHMPLMQIAQGYREFKPYLPLCKFRDCDHQKSPGCALIKAMANKEISADRYDNFIKISTQFSS